MRLPDGTLLMHGDRPYDPRKAHEYYMRTRKLKGRKRGVAEPTMGSGPVSDAQVKTRQRREANERIATLKKNISKLKAELRKRQGEAEVNRQKAAKPDTAAEKAEAARDAKKYRDKHKSELKSKAKKAADKKPDAKKKSDDSSIEGLKKAISSLETKLAAAVARRNALG